MNGLNQILKRSWITFTIVVVILSISTFIIPGTIKEYATANGQLPDIPILNACLHFVSWLQDNIIVAFIFQVFLTINIYICSKTETSKLFKRWLIFLIISSIVIVTLMQIIVNVSIK